MGKQYKVSQNDVIIVERLKRSGAKINLDKVLMISEGENTTVGTPTIEGALVAAEVLEPNAGTKSPYSKRKNYRRTMGHRQELTVLRITDILAAGEKNPLQKRQKQNKNRTHLRKLK